MRNWRQYAHDLEAMLSSECDMIRQDVERAVWIEMSARSWLPSGKTQELAAVISGRVARERWSSYETRDKENP